MNSMIQGYDFEGQLPPGFIYPQSYLEAIAENLEISPWWYVVKNKAYADLSFRVINKKLPEGYCLVPFAKCDDGDYVACFDGRLIEQGATPRIFIYRGERNFEGIDMESRFSIPSFDEWLALIRNW